MDWLAVRAWMVTELEVGLDDAVGVAEGEALGLAVLDGVLEGLTRCGLSSVSGAEEFAGVAFDSAVVDPAPCSNSVLLAGTSLRNEAKIALSSGCFHKTLALSPRGTFGIVKKAILLLGMPRRDWPRL
jgi:hypothetical protein